MTQEERIEKLEEVVVVLFAKVTVQEQRQIEEQAIIRGGSRGYSEFFLELQARIIQLGILPSDTIK